MFKSLRLRLMKFSAWLYLSSSNPAVQISWQADGCRGVLNAKTLQEALDIVAIAEARAAVESAEG